MIKKLKLIGYVLAYIALFFGVIIAINYIEGNGIRSAINHIGDRVESPQARGDVQLAEAPGSFTNTISGESWIINDEKVGLMRHRKITPSISDFRDNCITILDPGTDVFVLRGSKNSDLKYCQVKSTRQKLQGWILATSVTNAQKSKNGAVEAFE